MNVIAVVFTFRISQLNLPNLSYLYYNNYIFNMILCKQLYYIKFADFKIIIPIKIISDDKAVEANTILADKL